MQSEPTAAGEAVPIGGYPLGNKKSKEINSRESFFLMFFLRLRSSRQPGDPAWTGLDPRVRQEFLYKLLPNSLFLDLPGNLFCIVFL